MLDSDNAVLIVVDVQGKLAQLMHEKDRLFDNLSRLIRGAGVLALPVICTEQNPKALGPTIPQLAPLVTTEPIPKLTFSCCQEARFMDELTKLGRRQVLLSGIEAHICIYQTSVELVENDYDVHVIADAVSSRTAENRQIALDQMRSVGAKITSTEAALFELLRTAEREEFRHILELVK